LHEGGMIKNKEIIIMGASSYVGRNLFSEQNKCTFIGTYNNNFIDGGIFFNALLDKVDNILDNYKALTHGLILLADTNPETCALDRKKSQKINVDSIRSILHAFKKRGIKPIFMSSEYVFDGIKGYYVEKDVPDPILTYGQQKVEIENYIQRQFDDYVILRLAKVYGSDLRDNTLFSKSIEMIINNRKIHCADDQHFSPIYIGDVVNAIIKIIECDCNGIYHLAGPNRSSRLELLVKVYEEIRKYRSIDIEIIPCSLHDFDVLEKRPEDVSMIPQKLIDTIDIKMTDETVIIEGIVRKKFIKS